MSSEQSHHFSSQLFQSNLPLGDGPPASALNLTDPSAAQSDIANFTLDETNTEAMTAANEQEKLNGYVAVVVVVMTCSYCHYRDVVVSLLLGDC